ncbi:hypothetical protein RP20_CCG001797 [Aedes albopictus]|nr:hypothetical protein RP20_CCG026032 [Aedes albopictus]KXJ79262.1 hypothetical protein RP20_CCG001797 [Aedes albopictus]
MLCNVLECGEGEEILVQIIEAAARRNVALQWIPSHISIYGNDLADQLAKQGTRQHEHPMENQLLANDALQYFKGRKKEVAKQWYEEYSQTKGKTFYSICPTLEENPWFTDVNMKGSDIRLLNRLMTGHNYSKYWLGKMKLVDDTDCDLCEEAETAEHTILHCPRYNNMRSNFNFDGRYRNLVELFNTKDLKTYEEVVKYVHITKLNL